MRYSVYELLVEAFHASSSSPRFRPLARYWIPIGVLRDKLYFIYGVTCFIATSFTHGVTSFIFSNKFYIWRDKFTIFKHVLYTA